ncbi:nuclear fragile X mental retardation-interacting protein 1 isoform X2 [Brienomyrus brachyistius]|uniref:nuclear fragile X mental retardation-interacting protein 1 isoform X2 n=1 Tax=Brienomyrus brachyistius TaxID=42636 RepID=UPI0020B1F781|nr:nuclear fragile X mental retardation-interacting protein 1 isoform X2 [Brienomyrus brachyistius]
MALIQTVMIGITVRGINVISRKMHTWGEIRKRKRNRCLCISVTPVTEVLRIKRSMMNTWRSMLSVQWKAAVSQLMRNLSAFTGKIAMRLEPRGSNLTLQKKSQNGERREKGTTPLYPMWKGREGYWRIEEKGERFWKQRSLASALILLFCSMACFRWISRAFFSAREGPELTQVCPLFRRMRGRGRGFRQRGGRFQNNQRRAWSRPGMPGHVMENTTAPPLKHTPKDGDPLGAIVNSDLESDKDEAADAGKDGLTVTPKHMTSGLGALVANYDSTSESDQEPEALPILKVTKMLEENQVMLKTVQGQPPPQGSRAPPAAGPPWAGTAPNRPGRGRHPFRGPTTPQQRRPTLLEMLLAPEVRHERNVLLQCVRFVVQNAFFGLDVGAEESAAVDSRSVTALEGKRRPQTGTGVATSDGNHQYGLDLSEQNVGVGRSQSAPEAPSLDGSTQDCGQDSGKPGSSTEKTSASAGHCPTGSDTNIQLPVQLEEQTENMLAEEQEVDGDVPHSEDRQPSGNTQHGGFATPGDDSGMREEQNAQPAVSVVDEDVWEIPEAYTQNI